MANLGGTDIWIRDLGGDYPLHGQRPGREFQTQVERRMKGGLPWRTPDGRWRYNSAAAARDEAGFLTMEDYIRRRQNTVVQNIAMQSLLDLCKGLERDPGS